MSNNNTIYNIVPISGKGRGIVSNQSIARGTEILSEAPLIVVPYASPSPKDLQKAIAASLSTKSVDDKRCFLSLSNCQTSLPPLVGIFKTNALPCGDHDPLTGAMTSASGIFLQGSLFNSSCVPNVRNCWDEKEEVLVFRALRDIAEGEELCICYGNVFQSRDARRARLKRIFDFECNCDACSLQGEALQNSDRRREDLERLYHEIGECAYQPRMGVIKVKLALRLLQEENLFVYRDSFAYDAFQFCVSVSDLVNARAWIKKARDECLLQSGPNSESAEKFERYLKNPKDHLAWGIMASSRLVGPQ